MVYQNANSYVSYLFTTILLSLFSQRANVDLSHVTLKVLQNMALLNFLILSLTVICITFYTMSTMTANRSSCAPYLIVFHFMSS